MRINWPAVAIHSGVAAVACILAGVFSSFISGVPWLGVALAWPVVSVFYVAHEAWTAADRHDTTWRDGWAIVMSGEPGWSPWNLRLQWMAPTLAGLIVLIVAGRL